MSNQRRPAVVTAARSRAEPTLCGASRLCGTASAEAEVGGGCPREHLLVPTAAAAPAGGGCA